MNSPNKSFLSVLSAALLCLCVTSPALSAQVPRQESNLIILQTLRLGASAAGTISPSQITSNQNNYAPTGHAAAGVMRLSSDASRNITGLAGGAFGRVLIVYNVGAFDLVLISESASSTAANRFALVDDLTLEPNGLATLFYDDTSDRWRTAAGSGSGGGGGSGTVTNTGGSLTSNYIVLGAGTADTKVAAGLQSDGTSKLILGVAGSAVGSIDFKNATSGTVNVAPKTGALGTVNVTWPAASGAIATTDDANTAANVANANSQSSNYTLVLADKDKTLYMTSGSANALTIPPNSSVAFAVGTRIPGWTTGAGVTTITAGVGVTLNSRGGALESAGQYAAWLIEKTATDTWLVTGDLVP